MLFNSAIFAFFIVTVLAVYGLLRKSDLRKLALLVASYLFYAGWDWRYVSLLALSTLVDFTAGSRMHAAKSQGARRAWLLASLVTNLGVLAIFKYGNFLLDQLDPVLSVSWELPTEIPVGISFYTFQTLSYTIDIYRRQTTPCASLRDFALYVAFFSQLVAGPIVRSTEFLPQLESMKSPRAREVSLGAQRFIFGLFKKVVIADNVGLFVDSVFADPGSHGAVTLWCAMYGFALQIYCDFSAYTDMALGIARAFNLKLPENFDAPYLSRSLTEFWRRWHQSLSRWLRDYLYIPLGGSRSGPFRTHFNLMLTMLLGGLWHGAAWSFVLWGGYMGLVLTLERALGLGRAPSPEGRWRPRDWLGMIATFHIVCFGWVVFRGVDMERITTYFDGMATGWNRDDPGMATGAAWALATAVFCLGQFACRSGRLKEKLWDPLHPAAQGLVLALLLVLVSAFRVQELAFIYFQF